MTFILMEKDAHATQKLKIDSTMFLGVKWSVLSTCVAEEGRE